MNSPTGNYLASSVEVKATPTPSPSHSFLNINPTAGEQEAGEACMAAEPWAENTLWYFPPNCARHTQERG